MRDASSYPEVSGPAGEIHAFYSKGGHATAAAAAPMPIYPRPCKVADKWALGQPPQPSHGLPYCKTRGFHPQGLKLRGMMMRPA